MIDLEEKNKYNLFPAIQGFQSAVFFRSSDGRYKLEITVLDKESGEEKLLRSFQTESAIKLYRNMIEKVK